MEIKDGEIVVTVRARSMPELREKLLAILGETEKTKEIVEEGATEDFPSAIKELYPDYIRHPHSAAMLTLLHEMHKGEEKAVTSWILADEMMTRFPRLFKGKTRGQVSFGNIFPGNFLQKKRLINIGYTKAPDGGNNFRLYWVE